MSCLPCRVITICMVGAGFAAGNRSGENSASSGASVGEALAMKHMPSEGCSKAASEVWRKGLRRLLSFQDLSQSRDRIDWNVPAVELFLNAGRRFSAGSRGDFGIEWRWMRSSEIMLIATESQLL